MDDMERTLEEMGERNAALEAENARLRHGAGVSRRQLLAGSAGLAGVVAGAGLFGGSRPASAAAPRAASGLQPAITTVPPLNIVLAVKGQKQGQFKGDKLSFGPEWMTAYALGYEITVPHSSAGITGVRQEQPIVVTKPLNGATPQFLSAAATNETLTEVDVNLRKTNVTTEQDYAYYLIKLTNAHIVDHRQYVSGGDSTHYEAFGGMQVVEDVTFIFQKIEIKHVDAGTTFTDTIVGRL